MKNKLILVIVSLAALFAVAGALVYFFIFSKPEILPDLVISDSGISLSVESVKFGDTVTLSAEVQNLAEADAENIRVQFLDEPQDEEAVQIGETQVIAVLAAGESGLTSVQWTPKQGGHIIIVKIDPAGEISEASEDNNEARQSLIVSAEATNEQELSKEEFLQKLEADEKFKDNYNYALELGYAFHHAASWDQGEVKNMMGAFIKSGEVVFAVQAMEADETSSFLVQFLGGEKFKLFDRNGSTIIDGEAGTFENDSEPHSCDYWHCVGACCVYHLLKDPLMSQICKGFCEACVLTPHYEVCTACVSCYVGGALGCVTYCGYDKCAYCKDDSCGSEEWSGQPYCSDHDVYRQKDGYKCVHPGQGSMSQCEERKWEEKIYDCGETTLGDWGTNHCQGNDIVQSRPKYINDCEGGACYSTTGQEIKVMESCPYACHNAACVNAPPTADAGPDQTVELSELVALNGSGSDIDGSVVKYEWDFDGNGSYDWNSTNGGSVMHTYPNTGTYQATLRVTDNEGATGTDRASITIACPNPPTASAGADINVALNQGFTLDGSASAAGPGHNIVEYIWYVPDAPGGDQVAHSQTTATYVVGNDHYMVASPASRSIELEVVDERGCRSAKDEMVAFVGCSASQKPTADAGPDQTVTTGDTIVLDGSGSSDPDGTIVQYWWFSTDIFPAIDQTSSGPTLTIPAGTYDAQSNIRITLGVTDDSGCSSELDEMYLTIETAAPITASGWVSPSTVVQGNTATWGYSVTNPRATNVAVYSIRVNWYVTPPGQSEYLAEVEDISPSSVGWITGTAAAGTTITIYEHSATASGMVGSWRAHVLVETSAGTLVTTNAVTIQ